VATFQVRMASYDEPRNRQVVVPDNELNGIAEHDLEKIFFYGQNDFQPQQVYSVSVGDVAQYGGELYMVVAMGFHKITEEQYNEMQTLPLEKRRLYAYRLSATTK